MKIAQILIQSATPFADFQLDLRYPDGHAKAGQPLDNICLIGPNGTGKSNLLRILSAFLRDTLRFKSKGLFVAKLLVGERYIYSVHINNNALLFREEIDQEPMWMFELIRDQAFTMAFNSNYEKYCIGHEEEPELYDELWFVNNGNDLLVMQPADFARDGGIGLTDVPAIKPQEAESLIDNFPYYNEISPAKITEFWTILGFLFHQRAQNWKAFVEDAENKGKPESMLKSMFEQMHAPIFERLAAVWNPILATIGAEVDLKNAVPPINIRDKATITLKSKASNQRIEFGDLGTGIRRLLLNLGHVWALSFDRHIRHGFTFVEDPETSLHPLLESQVLGMYKQLLPKGQFFVSTNSAIVASQFDPAERIILARDAKGLITTRRSECQLGAPVAQVLEADFMT